MTENEVMEFIYHLEQRIDRAYKKNLDLGAEDNYVLAINLQETLEHTGLKSPRALRKFLRTHSSFIASYDMELHKSDNDDELLVFLARNSKGLLDKIKTEKDFFLY